MSDSEENERLLTRVQLAEELTARGYQITVGTLSQLAHRGLGPPVEVYWGGRKRPLYVLSRGLAWAMSRCVKPVMLDRTSEPAA
jgi:hypothetical protein